MLLISRRRANRRLEAVGILLILGITAIDFGDGGLINRKAGKIKIVGGVNGQRGKWKWQALILTKKKTDETKLTLCGGTLINSSWVLTAAHCVEHHMKIRVYFGVWNISNRVEVGRTLHLGKRVVQHPCYENSFSGIFSGSNLALIELSTPEYRYPAVCLSDCLHKDWAYIKKGNILSGCVATGYGVTDNGKDAEVLQEVEFSSVSMIKCYDYKTITAGGQMICATDDLVKGKDTCKGDMGGPLVCPTSVGNCNGYYLAGVTLAGSSNCGERGKPGIYAAVHSNLDWINSVLQRNGDCTEKQDYSCLKTTNKIRPGSYAPVIKTELFTRELLVDIFD